VNSLLAAAFITYLSSAPEDLRQSLMAKWQDLLGMNNFSFTIFLGSEKEQLQWLSEGLPSDQLSIQNALIILQVIAAINTPQLSLFLITVVQRSPRKLCPIQVPLTNFLKKTSKVLVF